MTTDETTLKRYREADEEHRLTLFLFHRELRQGFEAIDRAEMEADDNAERQAAAESTKRRWLARLWAGFRSDNERFDAKPGWPV